jgi:hypothetical protein
MPIVIAWLIYRIEVQIGDGIGSPDPKRFRLAAIALPLPGGSELLDTGSGLLGRVWIL